MHAWRMVFVFSFCLALSSAFAPAFGATLSLSLVNPGDGTVYLDEPATLEVRATFDTALSAISFQLAASGVSDTTMIARSLDPVGPNGLTYVSLISQSPFDDNLPWDLKANSLIEVAYDNDFGGVPGGPQDGLTPGSDVLIETITLDLDGQPGLVTVTVEDPRAAETTSDPEGAVFENTSVSAGSVVLQVLQRGDADQDYDVDLVDFTNFPGCMTGPDLGPESPACDVFDFDRDSDVDMEDYRAFQDVVAG